MKKLIGAMLACLMAGSLMAATPEITNSTGGIKSEWGVRIWSRMQMRLP